MNVDDPLPPQKTATGNRIEVGGRRSPGVGSPEKSTAGKIDPGESGLAINDVVQYTDDV